MQSAGLAWRRHGATLLFVLLWSGGALAAKWGLTHASAFAFLVIRLGVALAALTLVAFARRQWWPAAGSRWQVAGTGVLLIGGYQAAYLLALAHGITPGALATVLGVQPILTLVALERAHGARRLTGLAVALAGLALVVAQSLMSARLSVAGSAWALAALACMTLGTLAVDRAEISIGGSGDVSARGAVRDLKVNLGGSGGLQAPGLRAASAQVSSAGSGTIRATVDGSAQVSVVGSGTVDLGPKARCSVTRMGKAEVRCGS